MASAWYYAQGGMQHGPVSSQELRQLAQSGQLQPTDQVWKEGMAQWVPASKIKGVFPSTQAEPVSQVSPAPAVHDFLQSLFTESSKRKRVFIAAGAGLLVICAICILSSVSGMLSRQRTEKEIADRNRQMEEEGQQAAQDIAEANGLWRAGNKPAAVTKYKAVLGRPMVRIPKGEEPSVFQRVIEFEFAQGNTSAAKGFVEQAAGRSVPLSFTESKLKEFAEQTTKDWRERQDLARAKLMDRGKKGDGKAVARLQSEKDLAEATRLWEAGDRAAAVTKYKAIIQRGITLIGTGERPTIFQRVIEFEVAQGNASAARGFIEEALGRSIPLALVEPKAKELAAPIEKEWREKQALAVAKTPGKKEDKTQQVVKGGGKYTYADVAKRIKDKNEKGLAEIQKSYGGASLDVFRRELIKLREKMKQEVDPMLAAVRLPSISVHYNSNDTFTDVEIGTPTYNPSGGVVEFPLTYTAKKRVFRNEFSQVESHMVQAYDGRGLPLMEWYWGNLRQEAHASAGERMSARFFVDANQLSEMASFKIAERQSRGGTSVAGRPSADPGVEAQVQDVVNQLKKSGNYSPEAEKNARDFLEAYKRAGQKK